MNIIQVDYKNNEQMKDLLAVLNHYACDPMGGGEALSLFAQKNLQAELIKRKDALSLLAYENNQAIALLNAFEGFSTFKCKALFNIHDICVNAEYRCQGVATQLLQRLEEIARERDYCKLTLEVLQGNEVAQSVYARSGFKAYELDPAMGQALFWEKII